MHSAAQSRKDLHAKGWGAFLWCVKSRLQADNAVVVAGGLALFAMLSVFPSLTAAVAIYGIFASPEQISTQLEAWGDVLPRAASEILQQQLDSLANQHHGSLSAGLVFAVLLALWSARRGMSALMISTNVAFDGRDRRSLPRRLLVSLAFTLAGILGFLAMVVLGLAVPVALTYLRLGAASEWVQLVVRWGLLWCVLVLALAAVYRFAPHRTGAQWKWLGWGAGIAATLWIVASILFSLYLRHFDTFGQMYGALAGVAVLLMWFYISSFVVILGAEINSELERQGAPN